MARESEIRTNFLQAIEIAWKIKPIRSQRRKAMMIDKSLIIVSLVSHLEVRVSLVEAIMVGSLILHNM